ncbi:hypothetical protein FJZ31_08110 [Candidatus Poribacteria bacterium]|nr:hypothetical protein [Candidatus Poribacteria bacterium]
MELLSRQSDDPNLTTDDTLYVDWAVANLGNADITTGFYYYLYVDGGYVQAWYSDSLRAGSGYYASIEDYSIGKLSAGTHTIKIQVIIWNTTLVIPLA